MPPSRATAAQLLELLADKASALRAAGVRRVELEGLKFEIAAPEMVPTQVGANEEADEHDVMNDPATYGLAPGSRLPGFTRRPREEDEEDAA